MGEGYPTLIGVAAADRGCLLLLSDGTEMQVDVTARRIDAHLARRGLPSIEEYCRRRSVAVLGDFVAVGDEQWDRLMQRLRDSAAVQQLAAERPGLTEALSVTCDQASDLPLRIFECFHRNNIYLFYPYNFLPEQDEPGWYRVNFELRGEWVLQGKLHIETGAVDVFAADSWCIPTVDADPEAATG